MGHLLGREPKQEGPSLPNRIVLKNIKSEEDKLDGVDDEEIELDLTTLTDA